MHHIRIDLRSDTVTRPTSGMRQAMALAEVGDDMFGEDPTVNELEARMADLLGKPRAVFACSGTQSNQMGLWAHCQPGDELLIEATSHIANYEGGAPAVLSGITCRTLAGSHGLLSVADLEGKVRPDNQHFCRTRLVCLENTTNVGGGRVYPLETLQGIGNWARDAGVRVHLDGARLFNAVVATGVPAREICRTVDSVSVCFSKGLGCPMGSILAGGEEEIHRARRARKIFGGALRQAGIVAAAALYALDHHIERLQEDHDHARLLGEALSVIPGVQLDPPDVQTNIIFFTIPRSWGTAAVLSTLLRERGVLMNATGPQRLRACTHLDVTAEDCTQAAETVALCLKT